MSLSLTQPSHLSPEMTTRLCPRAPSPHLGTLAYTTFPDSLAPFQFPHLLSQAADSGPTELERPDVWAKSGRGV
jgi:hypothetical protein